MNRKYLVLAKIGLVFVGISLSFSVKTWAGTLIPISSVTYNGLADGDDWASGITIDGGGNIIVTGYVDNGTNDDYFTIKYNSDLSMAITSATYNGPTGFYDRAFGVVIDGGENIIVAGTSVDGINMNYFTIV